MKIDPLAAALLLLLGCATVDVPPGGDIDIVPPKLISSYPDSAETLVSPSYIKMEFDEYIVLNNLKSNLIISPPLRKGFDVKQKRKSLTIELNEYLSENTTYQFYFGNTIKDLNEGNETKDLRLIFSTGSYLDSSTLGGRVLDAYTKEKQEGVKVFLYTNPSDSSLYNETPQYLTLTNKSGRFIFQNIKDTSYFVFAVKDENNNNRLDPKESVAFSKLSYPPNTDSCVLHLFTNQKIDSLSVETPVYLGSDLYAFAINGLTKREKIFVESKYGLTTLNKLNHLPYWLNKAEDSIFILCPFFEDKDTCEIQFHQGNSSFYKKFTKSQKNTQLRKSLIFTESTFNLYTIKANYPIKKINSKQFSCLSKDSIPQNILDTIYLSNSNSLVVKIKHVDFGQAELIIKPEAILYHDQTNNDLNTLNLVIRSKKEFGTLKLELQNVPKENDLFLVQEKNKGYNIHQSISKDTTLVFTGIEKGKYEFYLYKDQNKNMQWDYGDYIKKQLSEPIWRLNSPIEIRSNWENEIIFDLSK